MTNPYWDEVVDHVTDDRLYGLVVGGLGPLRDQTRPIEESMCYRRREFVAKFAWTISDPATLDFVLEHCGQRVVDPMAGTGYWAWLLTQAGRDVVASDVSPPAGGTQNNWHVGGKCFVDVEAADAVHTVAKYPDRTLLLMWPPYSDLIGERTVRAYSGDRILYVGEDDDGCCGTEAMFKMLDNEKLWTRVAGHRPIQWSGLHDDVAVYQRVGLAPRRANPPDLTRGIGNGSLLPTTGGR